MRTAIFAPYRQAEPPNTRHHGGLGLGLAVARRAAEGAGGSLVLEPGEPTTFRLVLPLREDPIVRQARALRDQAQRMDEQALRAMQDVRTLRSAARHERGARELAERQQLRAVNDFRAAHRDALALAQRLDSAYLETISALARAVEARDSYTGGHVERVRLYSQHIGDACGLGTAALQPQRQLATRNTERPYPPAEPQQRHGQIGRDQPREEGEQVQRCRVTRPGRRGRGKRTTCVGVSAPVPWSCRVAKPRSDQATRS